MYVLCVTAYVKPENINDFLATTAKYASLTRQEKGNVRYDVLQSDEDSTCFVIYEAYQSKDDFLVHRDTVHSLQWKEKIESWMARPRQRIRCNSIIFGND
jgi:autoinducer 2-degrading protein